MKTAAIAVSLMFLVILVLARYFFISSDQGLIDRNYALRVASDALGDSLYGITCSRDKYAWHTQILENKSSFVFGFTPKVTSDKACVFTKVIVDRRTGEIWIDTAKGAK
ncbi:hypothetical protein K7B09_05740 [Thermomonas sp. RSS23]|uniref:MSHA biogenesis protein MshP n=1 Tax=Thermomonas beijingensis TaxID=2872701 RepID=A0ABS7TD93_9GAMM|nr:hypothetical protein [Thermomonas beijingensis]MBZ4185829.1 hypothetical protein [Thermomonas beijingensis]